MKRLLIGLVVLVVLVLAVGYAFRRPLALRMLDRRIQQNMTASLVDELPDGLHVGLCGAGSPLPDAERSGPCTAVIAGKNVYVVDSGAGGSETMARMRIPQARIDAILLTHFHSDHIDGLGELMMQRWVQGTHLRPVPVYGPPGIGQVVHGFRIAYAQDTVYRVKHHGNDTVPRTGSGGTALRIELPGEGHDVVVLEEDGLRITAFLVDHAPIDPAVGYRFDYGGRSVVVSGDTTKSSNLQRVADNVDLLIHEALSDTLVAAITKAAAAQGRANLEKITRDILDYHTTPIEAAEIARDAKVGHLLFNHIVPPLPIAPLRDIFLDGVDDVYTGPVTLGTDGTFISLPVGSDEISVQQLL